MLLSLALLSQIGRWFSLNNPIGYVCWDAPLNGVVCDFFIFFLLLFLAVPVVFLFDVWKMNCLFQIALFVMELMDYLLVLKNVYVQLFKRVPRISDS